MWIVFSVGVIFPVHPQDATNETEAPLRNITEILELSESEKRLGQPVELECVVMHYDPAWSILWVAQNETIAYIGPTRVHPDLNVGDRVLLRSKTTDVDGSIHGDFTFEKIAKDQLPDPITITEDNVYSVADQSAYVSGQMVVSGFRDAEDHAILNVRIGAIEGDCYIITSNPNAFGEFQEAEISIEGLLFKGDDKDKFTLMTSKPGNVRVIHSDLKHLFQGERIEISDLLNGDLPVDHRITIEGNLLRVSVGENLVLEDPTGILIVPIWQSREPSVGEPILVSGFPAMGENGVTLSDVAFLPREVFDAPSTEISGDYLHRLVRRVDHVRNLSQAEFSEIVAVLLNGVVTYRGGSKLFLEDSTGAIEIVSDDFPPDLAPGQRIQVQGNAYLNGQYPAVRASQIIGIGESGLPRARVRSIEQLIVSHNDHGNRIEVSGYVGTGEETNGERSFSLGGDFGRINIILSPDFEGSPPPHGALIDAIGVAEFSPSNKDRVRLLVDRPSRLQIVEMPPENPFDIPAKDIEALISLNYLPPVPKPGKLVGSVTWSHPEHPYFYLQDATGGILVINPTGTVPSAGQAVEVVGRPTMGDQRITIRATAIQETDQSTAIIPGPLEEGMLLESIDHRDRLIRTTGRLVSFSNPGKIEMFIQSGTDLISADIENMWDVATERLKAGSVLELTGVLDFARDSIGRPSRAVLHLQDGRSFKILSTPSWWTPVRTASLIGILVLLVGTGLIWVTTLQHRVKLQTSQISQQLDRELGLLERHRKLVDNAKDLIFSCDIFGRVTSWNKAGENLLGRPRDEIMGELFELLLANEDRESWMAALDSAASKGEPFNLDVRLLTDDGEDEIWLNISGHPAELRDQRTEIEAIARNVTEQRKVRETLLAAKEAAESATRAKSDFLANMSHEIRTPMNGVIGMSSILLDTELTQQQLDYVKTINSSAEGLLTIINDILDFSKIEAGKLLFESIDFDLREAVDGALGLLAERAAAKKLEIAAFIPHGITTALVGDAGRLRQVLLNLLSNGVKFTEKGEVTLKASVIEESDADIRLRFEIADTGIGMSQDAVSRIFKPFEQADTSTTRRFGGTGLGLVISRQIVELMNGEIGVESTEGKGTTFWFTCRFEKQPPERARAPRVPVQLNGRRVLVVDDNTTNREILHHFVVSWGMLNGSASSGEQAIKLLSDAHESGRPYDAVLLDYQMPGMDGLQVAERIHSDGRFAYLKIILLTSMGQPDSAEKLRAQQIAYSLTKPVAHADLMACMQNVLAPSQAIIERKKESADDGSPKFTGLHLLLAEDNVVNQKVATLQLRKLGISVETAGNGLEALAALERSTFDAVLMDCQMPEMDGYEATAAIRNHSDSRIRDTIVIAMTANAISGEKERCLETGMNDFVSKPVNMRTLSEAIERCLSFDKVPQEEVSTKQIKLA